ncbi:MAG: GAP family protein [Mycobacterium sp.]|uniref:GAP family protein n=1 Tax=Mycobacterium sp. TaxID=1785 RepID=UPI003BB0A3A2
MGTVLVLALMMATDPVRLGVTLLLISRPRPILNLLAYWLGAMLVGVTAAVVVLTMMRDFAPTLLQNLSSLAATPVVRHAQIAFGVLALLLAALTTAGLPARQRLRVPVSVGGDPSALLLQPSTPPGISQLLGRARRVLGGESLWVALAAGIGTGPAPLEYLVALTAILAMGGAIGTQISAAVVFNVVMLAVCEITLVSYLATPTRTLAIIDQLNSWVRTHRRRILSLMIGVAGVCLVVTGSG